MTLGELLEAHGGIGWKTANPGPHWMAEKMSQPTGGEPTRSGRIPDPDAPGAVIARAISRLS